MKLVVSADGLSSVNADLVKKFYVDISQEDGYYVCADETILSCHHSVEHARKEFNRIIEVIWDNTAFVLNTENEEEK